MSEDRDKFYFRFKQGREKKLVIIVHQLSNKELTVERCFETEYGIHGKELWWETLRYYYPLVKIYATTPLIFNEQILKDKCMTVDSSHGSNRSCVLPAVEISMFSFSRKILTPSSWTQISLKKKARLCWGSNKGSGVFTNKVWEETITSTREGV